MAQDDPDSNPVVLLYIIIISIYIFLCHPLNNLNAFVQIDEFLTDSSESDRFEQSVTGFWLIGQDSFFDHLEGQSRKNGDVVVRVAIRTDFTEKKKQ